MKIKKIIAAAITILIYFATVSSSVVFAESNTSPYLFWEDFQDAINLKGSEAGCEAANGFWACNDNGSEYTLESGTMKYTKRMAKDYMDIRFYYDGTAQNLSRDFLLSFKIKPLASDFGCEFAWGEKTPNQYDKSLSISSGRFRAGKTTYADVVLEKDNWYLVEIAFNYDENASSVTGETGAITSYTIMVNGKALATAEASIKHHNMDHFRLFRMSSCVYELDDLIVATGSETLDTNNSFADWTPKNYYLDSKEAVTDYTHSFCIVGDTQKVTKTYPDKLANIYDWIVNNTEAKKIEYVFGLGDITDTSSTAEWNTAKAQINKLNGVVPYSLARGNHDTSDSFNSAFNTTAYTSQFDGFFESGKIDNSYARIQVGDIKYLMLTLDYGPTDAALEWAADIIEANPDHLVIITTHAYLLTDGSAISSDHIHAPSVKESNPALNDGDELWDKLVSKYENIFLVLSGHIGSDYVITNQREGVNGNTVTEMLIDPQNLDGELGATGMITMLYFSEDGTKIEVETYSTVHQKYFLEENQFSIDISSWADGIGGNGSGIEGGSGNDNPPADEPDTEEIFIPYIGGNGNWWIGEMDTGIRANGTDGQNGTNGLVPTVGENGNWWIGDTDTGVRANGNNGKDGVIESTTDTAVGEEAGSDTASNEELGNGCSGSVCGGAFIIMAATIGIAFTKKRRR